MKILQVISSFPPAYAYGGGPTAAYEISKELVKKGHDVTVYTTDAYSLNSRFKYTENPIWLDGIEVYHFKNISNKYAYVKNLSLAPEMAFALNKNIKKYDIVHLHEYRSFQSIFVYLFTKKYGIPYILQSHGSTVNIIEKQKLKKLYDCFSGRRILKSASMVVAVTKDEAKQYKLININETKIEIIPNGIDLLKYNNLPKKGVFRKKYSINNDEKIVLFLGRIHKIKGIDLLLKAFADLIKKLDNVTLVIVGPDGGFLSALKQLIRELNIGDKVLLTGPLYEKDKLMAYVDANVCVLPSRYEIFGITALESCACGTPVIVTSEYGISNKINNIAGYAIRFDKNKLVNSILKVLINEELRKKFGKGGKELVRNQFAWNMIISKFEKMYLNIIK